MGRSWASLMSFIYIYIYMGSHIEFWMEFRNDWFIRNRILGGRSQVKRIGRVGAGWEACLGLRIDDLTGRLTLKGYRGCQITVKS
jgi:hypothetical protein